MTDVAEPGERGVSVVIPCLNEQGSIAGVIAAAQEGLRKLGLPGEVIVVDNGSGDRSAELAAAAGARVIPEPHRGYGSALRRGFAAARYSILVMGDGDLSYDFSRMDELVRPVLDGEADLAVGNRMAHIRPGAMPWLHRYVGNPLLSLILRMMFGQHIVRDAHCGLRAISRSAYRKLGCVTTGMEFASEMIVRAVDHRLRMVERPIVYHPRAGQSKLRSFSDGWRHLRFMMLHSPTTILLAPGAMFWLLGLALSLRLAFGPVMWDGRAIDIHCMIMAGLLNIVSVQVITLGLLAKAYAHLSGLRLDPVVAWFYRWFNFEKSMLLMAPLVVAGLGVSLWIVGRWMVSGFGELNEARPLFLAMLCLVNGVQLAAAAYLFSIMALPRHVDQLPPEAEHTGIVDQ